jgi:hypothetical protein
MKPCACVVRQSGSSYSVSLGSGTGFELGSDATSPDDLALAVLDFLQREKKLATAKDNIIFCPDPQSVLFATGARAIDAKPSDHAQLKYEAETFLPLDAERMTADFIQVEGTLRVLAVDQEELLPFVEAFHQQGMHFRWIAPAPILAIEEAAKAFGIVDGLILWDEENHCDLWRLDRHGPTLWHHVVGDPKHRQIAIRLFAVQAEASDAWTLFNANTETLQLVKSIVARDVQATKTESQAEWLDQAAHRLSKGTNTAWFDLRDGIVAGADRYRSLHGWMTLAALSVFLLLAAFPLACWWKKQVMSRSIAAIEQAENELFTGYFKNQPLPDHILVADFIARKHLEAKGSRNSAGEVENTVSALEVLHIALNAIKPQSQFVIDRLAIKNGLLEMDVNLKDLQAVSDLTNRLQSLGIDVQPPNTRAGPNNSILVTLTGPLKKGSALVKPPSSVSFTPESMNDSGL